MEEILQRMMALCAKREYCPSDIRTKIRALCIKKNLVLNSLDEDAIIERLTLEGFLDSGRYALAFAMDKARFDSWGPYKIRLALEGKGIERSLIDLALEKVALDPEADSRAKKTILSKFNSLKSDPAAYYKTVRFALSKGYDIQRVKDILKQHQDSEEI